MDILKFIVDQINSQSALNKLSQSSGAKPDKVQQLTQLGIPALLQALGRNTSTSEGAASLAKALDQHKDDDVENVEGFLNNVNTDDGAKILQHIFPGNKDRVQKNLAKQTGLNTGQVSSIMTQLAPLLLGALGKQKKQQNLDVSGITGLLSGLSNQGNKSGLMDVVNKLLDSDNDGNIIDDISSKLGRFFKK